MERGAKPAKAKIGASPPARNSPKGGGASGQKAEKHLAEALEQRAATSDILRVISQSRTDAQPVFDTIVAAALKLCHASSANVFTFDGKLIHVAAFVNVIPEYVAGLRRIFPRPPSRDTAVTRAVLTGSVCFDPGRARGS